MAETAYQQRRICFTEIEPCTTKLNNKNSRARRVNRAESEDKMGTWRDYIDRLKTEFIGKRVMYDEKPYTIVDVDMNGIVHIDRPTDHNKTTAVYDAYEARKALI